MDEKLLFKAAIEIGRLVNSIIALINGGADHDVARSHFQTISRIAAANAAKPEIQGYSEHE